MMKKILLLLLLISSLSFGQTNTRSSFFSIPQDSVQTEVTERNFIFAKANTNLWKVAKEFLGDGSRHMEVANLNFVIFQQSDRYRVSGKNPRWDYGEIKKGEKIYLPADAVGQYVLKETEERRVLKGNSDDYAYTQTINSPNNVRRYSIVDGLSDFWFWLLALLFIVIFLLFIVIFTLFAPLRDRVSRNNDVRPPANSSVDNCIVLHGHHSRCCEGCSESDRFDWEGASNLIRSMGAAVPNGTIESNISNSWITIKIDNSKSRAPR